VGRSRSTDMCERNLGEVLKRLLDVVAAAVGLVVLSPLMAVIALAIRWDSPGPVFYRAKRVGKGGKLFLMYKFRTMVADAEKMGPSITVKDDPRITRVGRFLRKTKLDELPQLINVLKGEMSLVGPRPETPSMVEHYTPEQRRVLEVTPGITGLAQLYYSNEEEMLNPDNWHEEYVRKILPHKLALDLLYIEHRSLALDLTIIGRTILKLVRRK